MRLKFRSIAIFAVLLFAAFGFKCSNPIGPTQETVLYSVPRPAATDATDCLYEASSFHQTPGGVTVRSCVDVPAEALAAIDRGILHQIRNSSHYNPTWTAFRQLTDYQIFLVPPMSHSTVDLPGAPTLLVSYLGINAAVAGPIQSAGTCIGVDGAMFVEHGSGIVQDPRYPSEVLPEQSAESWQFIAYFEESARNESEHLAEWENNKNMFHSFAITGDVHPHFPDWDTAPPMTSTQLKAVRPPILAFSPCSSVNGVTVCKSAGIDLPKAAPTATAAPVKKRK